MRELIGLGLALSSAIACRVKKTRVGLRLVGSGRVESSGFGGNDKGPCLRPNFRSGGQHLMMHLEGLTRSSGESTRAKIGSHEGFLSLRFFSASFFLRLLLEENSPIHSSVRSILFIFFIFTFHICAIRVAR